MMTNDYSKQERDKTTAGGVLAEVAYRPRHMQISMSPRQSNNKSEHQVASRKSSVEYSNEEHRREMGLKDSQRPSKGAAAGEGA